MIILIVILVLELFIAFVLYPLKHGKNYYWLIASWSGFIFRFDPVIGFTLKPNLVHQRPTAPLPNAPRRIFFIDVRTDDNGFLFTGHRDLVIELKESYRLIFCIGGSTTAGFASRHDKTYPAVLDSLEQRHGYRCINAGVGGYRSIHELLYFKNYILPWKPKAIIIFSGYNDFEDFGYGFYKPYNQFKHCFSHSLPTNNLEKLLSYSALFHFSKRLVYRLSKNIRRETISVSHKERLKETLRVDTWLDEWKNNIGKLIDSCKENGIKCYLLAHASPVYEDAPREAKDFAEKDLNMAGRFDIFVEYVKLIHKATIDLCKEKGAVFLDVTSDFNQCCRENGKIQYKKRFPLFVDRMHFTEEGNSLLAESIYKKIKKDL